MKLTGITITGADDGVNPRELQLMAITFPFVEWGILLGSREGVPRFPSKAWLGRVLDRVGTVERFSGHLCGSVARKAFAGELVVPDSYRFNRYQLNGFSSMGARLPDEGAPFRFMLDEIAFRGASAILQCQSIGALGDAQAHAHGCGSHVSALWDRSGGRGVAETDWPVSPGLTLGYAGGIDAGNIVKVITELKARPGLDEFWIDIETGARTDDRFDMIKVFELLKLAEPHVEG